MRDIANNPPRMASTICWVVQLFWTGAAPCQETGVAWSTGAGPGGGGGGGGPPGVGRGVAVAPIMDASESGLGAGAGGREIGRGGSPAAERRARAMAPALA